MSAKRKKSFDYAAEAKRNQDQFLESVRGTLPQMTNEQIFLLIKYLLEGK